MKYTTALLLMAVMTICSCTQKKKDTNADINNTNKDSIAVVKIDCITIINDSNSTTETKIENRISNEQTIKNISDIYNACKKTAQEFTIKPGVDTTIFCKEGTNITFHSNSLVYEETGLKVEQELKIFVTEYYKTSDIILANLSTTSDDKLLETGGMINIEAFAGGKKLILDKGEVIEISFSGRKKDDQMQLFNGEWTKKNINWKIKDTKDTLSIDNDVLFSIVENMPEFPGGINALYRFMSENILYPEAARDSGIQGRVILQFVVAKTGEIKDVTVVRGISFDLNTEAVRVVESMPKWKPGKQGRRIVNTRYTLPIVFKIEDGISISKSDTRSNDFYSEKRKMKKDEIEKKLKTEGFTNSYLNDYILLSSKLAWINCDRFYANKRTKTDYYTKIQENTEYDCYLVFPKIKSIYKGHPTNDKRVIEFENLPIGEPIKTIALKVENEQCYIATKETSVSKEIENDLNFKKVSLAELRKTLEKLNN